MKDYPIESLSEYLYRVQNDGLIGRDIPEQKGCADKFIAYKEDELNRTIYQTKERN